MIGWLVALFSRRGSAPVTPGRPGGTARRSRPTWTRSTARAPASWPRIARRSAPTLDRTWRYAVPTAPLATRSGDVLIAAVSDDRDYAFDLSSCPEIVGGATISSAVITGGTGLTIGAPAANAAAFDGIPIGKAVVVRIGGGVAGTTYDLACLATLSTGRVVVVPARLRKVADRDS